MQYICLALGDRWDGDPPYHPDDRDDICLTSELVEEIMAELDAAQRASLPLQNIIRIRERLHHDAVTGTLSCEEEMKQAEDLFQGYVKTFKRWPQQESFYDQFYREVNNGHWT